MWGSAYVNGDNWLARREGTACIVDLRDGQCLWCDVQSIALKKIRTPEGASRAVDELLKHLVLADAAVAPQAASAAPASPAPGVAAQPAKQAIDPESN